MVAGHQEQRKVSHNSHLTKTCTVGTIGVFLLFPGEEIRTRGDQTTYLIQGPVGPRTRSSMSPWPTGSLCSQPAPAKLKGFWLPRDSNSFSRVS